MSPLASFPLLQTSDVEEARGTLSNVFQAAIVEPSRRKGPFAMSLHGLFLGKLRIGTTHFSSGIDARVIEPLHIHTLQIPLAGQCPYTVDGRQVTAGNNRAVFLSAGEKVTVGGRDSGVMSLLNLVTEDAELRDFASAWLGGPPSTAIRFEPQLNMASAPVATLISMLELLARELSRPGGLMAHPAALASFEETLLTSMLFGLPHSLRDALQRSVPDGGSHLVQRVEDYLRAHSHEPITMDSLARVFGCSGSSIYRAFRERRDYSPLAFLHRERLKLARRKLLAAAPGDQVTGIAMDCGFMHLGRFSAEYRQRFGENPSETLQRAPRNRGR